MDQALVTVVAPLARDRLAAADAAIDALGNPARSDLADRLGTLDGEAGVHFMSLHALPAGDGRGAHLVLELSADGPERAALDRVAALIAPELATIFRLAADWGNRDGDALGAYLAGHRVGIGWGWFSTPGLAFAGTPGLTVGRIRQDARVAERAVALLAAQPGDMRPLDRLAQVRAALPADASGPADAAVPAAPPARSLPALVAAILLDFARTFLWPVGVAILVSALVAAIRAPAPGKAPGAALAAALAALGWSLLAVVLLAGAFYALLRRSERRDVPSEAGVDRATGRAMVERENHIAQNHMLSLTVRKPGIVRWVAIRLVLWLIAALSRLKYRPGYLGTIGTIHFARWVTVPRTRDFLFFSNFGGSWESYLEDFITLAHAGLTGVWSNSVGFPRTANLFQDGATDGERFKRYARASMRPTRFWFSAYPTLTTANIRTNALIRRGLSAARTADDAATWLALFGSAPRPPGKIESSDVQSLVFGGLGFMPHGACLLLSLPEDQAAARRLLARLRPHVAFNDGRLLRRRAVLTVALSAGALPRLGLPEACVAGFPAAFLDGMADPARARLLGDVGPNGPAGWRWGHQAPHAALLVYGLDAAAVARLEGVIERIARDHGGAIGHRVPLRPLDGDKREPFGFTDGISQPVIRGTYKGLRSADPIHLVEPGEFLIGYPDNRGNRPPGPQLAAAADPLARLPIVERNPGFADDFGHHPRDVARNCSYLVIRQLEQDVAAFDAYCAAEAERLAGRLGPPYRIDAEFIGAKLVGRWKDGSSIVRHPYQSLSDERRVRATGRPETIPQGGDAVPPAPRPTLDDDNDFLFGTEDPEALRCPFGAHVRRANPRDSLAPGSAEQIQISNRHRILRVGRFYAPDAAAGEKPGLLFMCLNGDIERQFEFIQQTWLASPAFHGLSGEQDPLLGLGDTTATGFLVPTRDGPLRLKPLPRFTTLRGGGYFLLPSRRLIDFLSSPSVAGAAC